MKLRNIKEGEIVKVQFEDYNSEITGRIRFLQEDEDGAFATYLCHNNDDFNGERILDDLKYGYKYSYWIGDVYEDERDDFDDDDLVSVERHSNNKYLKDEKKF